MITPNKQYNKVFITLKQLLIINGETFHATAQFKWLQKKFMDANSGCNCSKGYYSYLVSETANGRKLAKSAWVDDVYVYEDEELRPEVTRGRWEELRGDYLKEGNQDQLLPHQRTFGTAMTDHNGYLQVNEGSIPFPKK